jgi:hypothetical protein
MPFNTNEEALKKDFRNFLYLVWKHLRLPEPTKIQYEIAEYIQHGPRRKVLEAFRGVGKSWETSAYVVWDLWRNPQKKFLVVSASKGRADDFSTFTKRLIKEMPMLQHLKARSDQRDSMVAFDVAPARASHAPSVKSVGIFGQMTGARADEIIADDVEVPNNSYTQDMREKLIKRCMEFEDILKPNGKITYLGTPQTEESIYNKLRDKGYDCRIYPARYPEKAQIRKYEGALADTIVQALEADESLIGHSTDPDRFNDQDLLERETAKGRSAFALQFMLDTSLSDAAKYPLKLSDLIVMSTDDEKAPVSITWSNQQDLAYKELPALGFSGDRMYRPMRLDKEWVPYEGAVMAIDPSGRGADETTYAIVKQLYGYLYVTDFGGLKGGYDDATLAKLAKLARRHNVNEVVIEDNFGDGMFTQLFSPVLGRYHRCNIEEVKHHKQKEMRIIDTLEPIMNRHKLIIDFDAIRKDVEETYKDNRINYSLFFQMTRLTRQRGALKHDDRLDVLAMAVAYWIEALSRDEERALEEHREDLMDEELNTFMEHVLGKNGRRDVDLRTTSLGWN